MTFNSTKHVTCHVLPVSQCGWSQQYPVLTAIGRLRLRTRGTSATFRLSLHPHHYPSSSSSSAPGVLLPLTNTNTSPLLCTTLNDLSTTSTQMAKMCSTSWYSISLIYFALTLETFSFRPYYYHLHFTVRYSMFLMHTIDYQ